MNTEMILVVIAVVLGVITGIMRAQRRYRAVHGRKWQFAWLQYRANLRWYKKAKPHLLYMIETEGFLKPAAFLYGFNYWTGKVKMRMAQAKPGAPMIQEFHANQIAAVVFSNDLASESTPVE